MLPVRESGAAGAFDVGATLATVIGFLVTGTMIFSVPSLRLRTANFDPAIFAMDSLLAPISFMRSSNAFRAYFKNG